MINYYIHIKQAQKLKSHSLLNSPLLASVMYQGVYYAESYRPLHESPVVKLAEEKVTVTRDLILAVF